MRKIMHSTHLLDLHREPLSSLTFLIDSDVMSPTVFVLSSLQHGNSFQSVPGG